MKRLTLLLLLAVLLQRTSHAQNGKLDSLFAARDTTAVMDSLMKDFDLFLDSLSAPRSFFNVSVGIGTGFFSFENKNTVVITTKNKLIFSPSLGYYHKSGLGLSATAFMINDSSKLTVYQYAFSPSYDIIKRSFSTGISYTRYLHKDSLSFYVTPIQNELFAYFSYKKWWLRPTVSIAYGWGSKTAYEKIKATRKKRLQALLNHRPGRDITIRNDESIRDLSLTVSLRKDFNWYDVLGKDDNITFTPVILLNSGTQNFGFNTSYSYNFSAIRANSLPGNQYISGNTDFEPQSASLVLRGSYLKGKFLIQPQILFDYFLQDAADDDKFNTVFSLTAGFSF